MTTINKIACKKNYYWLKTMTDTLNKVDVISFDLFGVLLLEEFMLPTDIIMLTSIFAKEAFGLDKFASLRINTELELKHEWHKHSIGLKQTYSIMKERMPSFPWKKLMEKEQELFSKHVCLNPLVQEIYQLAVHKNKIIMVFTDFEIERAEAVKILKDKGYNENHTLFILGEHSGVMTRESLFGLAQEQLELDTKQWLHITMNRTAELENMRYPNFISQIKSPKQWFLEYFNTNKRFQGLELQDLYGDVDASVGQAKEINTMFTQKSQPADIPVVRVTDASMMFHISSEKISSIKEFFIRRIKGRVQTQELWAIRSISFTLYKGEKLGLIGLNGCGKSTLLKLIAGVLKATMGSVHVFGQVSPLIELGAGFDMELSARENVYLNGAILGNSHQQMSEYYDQIIEFAELKTYEDIALKNYSSGMVARLGFAIATCKKPDILIIDEILAVGDISFQQKCYVRMKELTDGGTTVIFVSHSPNDVINLCDRVIWLDSGVVVDEGETDFIISQYLAKNRFSGW